MRHAWIVGWLTAQVLQAQVPVASYPAFEFEGTVTRVLTAGRPANPPSLEVRTRDGRSLRVVLGSFRYLIEHNFNPKAGTVVHVAGFKSETEVFAREITLIAEKRTLRLRDEKGWPLWRFGRHKDYGKSQ